MESRKRVKRDEPVAFWRAHVARWRTSGVSQLQYSHEHGIRQRSLCYWIRRFKTPATPWPHPNLVEFSTAKVF